jgi:hypothetical protein
VVPTLSFRVFLSSWFWPIIASSNSFQRDCPSHLGMDNTTNCRGLPVGPCSTCCMIAIRSLAVRFVRECEAWARKRLHKGDTSRVCRTPDYEGTTERLTTTEPDAQYLKGTRDRYLSLDRVFSRGSRTPPSTAQK